MIGMVYCDGFRMSLSSPESHFRITFGDWFKCICVDGAHFYTMKCTLCTNIELDDWFDVFAIDYEDIKLGQIHYIDIKIFWNKVLGLICSIYNNDFNQSLTTKHQNETN